MRGVGAVSVCVGWELSACARGGSCQRVHGVGAVSWCMRVHSLQLEPRKNMLETLLRDNLEQRREELKKVRTTWGRCSEGSGCLRGVVFLDLLPSLCRRWSPSRRRTTSSSWCWHARSTNMCCPHMSTQSSSLTVRGGEGRGGGDVRCV